MIHFRVLVACLSSKMMKDKPFYNELQTNTKILIISNNSMIKIVHYIIIKEINSDSNPDILLSKY